MKNYKAIFLFFDKYIWALSSFTYLFFLAKALGPESFAIYSFFLSVALIFGFINYNYLATVITKEVIEGRLFTEEIFFTRTLYSLYLFIFLSALIYFSADFIFDDYFNEYKNIIFILLLGVFFQSLNSFEYYYHANLNVELLSKVKITTIIICLLIKLLVLKYFSDLYTVSLLFSLELFFINIISFILFLWEDKWRFNPFSKSVIVNSHKRFALLLKDNWPLFISFIAIVIYAKIDQYMVGILYHDKNSVGVLAIINRIIDGLVISISIVGTLFFPKLVSTFKTDTYLLNLKKYILTSILVSIILSISFSLVTNYFLFILLGFDIDSATVYVYTLTVFINCFSVAVGRVLIVEGLITTTLYRNLVAVFVNVVLNYVLIPDYGILGAGIASFLSWFTSGFIFLIVSKKTRHIIEVVFK